MSTPDLRRAVVRSTARETSIVRNSDGTPLVFPNPSHCVKFLSDLRANQNRLKNSEGIVVYTMVALDDPTYKKLIKEKRVCLST